VLSQYIQTGHGRLLQKAYWKPFIASSQHISCCKKSAVEISSLKLKNKSQKHIKVITQQAKASHNTIILLYKYCDHEKTCFEYVMAV
jgi:hypothetical protein